MMTAKAITAVAACAIYVIGMWVAAFLTGFGAPRRHKMDDIDWMVVVFWPCAAVAIAVWEVGDLLDRICAFLWRKVPGKGFLAKVAKALALPFRPYRLGGMAYDLLERVKSGRRS